MMDRPVLLMTRPRAASERFLAELASSGLSGFRTIISPVFDIRPSASLPDLTGIQALIFTSAHSVTSYTQIGGRTDLPCYTVGPATAAAATSCGMQVMPSSGSGADLEDFILQHPPQGPLMHLHGTHVAGDLARRLTQAGVPTTSCAIYDQPARPLNKAAIDAIQGPLPVVIPLFSPRSGRLLACTLGQGRSLLVAAMSAMVADTVAGVIKDKICIAQTPDSDSMRKCIAQLMQQAHSLFDGSGV